MDGMALMPSWIDVCALEDIPPRGARRVSIDGIEIGVFRTAGDRVFAIDNRCPHKQGPLTEGIVHDTGVTCPLHSMIIDLATGAARAPDTGCVRTYPAEVRQGRIHVKTGS